MGILNKITGLFNKKPEVPDTCASGYPNWEPNANWLPEFDDDGVTAEAYDGN